MDFLGSRVEGFRAQGLFRAFSLSSVLVVEPEKIVWKFMQRSKLGVPFRGLLKHENRSILGTILVSLYLSNLLHGLIHFNLGRLENLNV